MITIVMVAPHAGAWIETACNAKYVDLPLVAPHAGAWIETTKGGSIWILHGSHPMRVRGLKHW